MTIRINLDSNENYTNIGFAKALTETNLSSEDLKEIAEYLFIFNVYHSTEKEGTD